MSNKRVDDIRSMKKQHSNIGGSTTTQNGGKTATEVLSGIRIAITHPGIFHADDVSTWAYLRLLGLACPLERRVPTAEEIEDPTVLVFDIGGLHDPKKLVFDHHQRGGAGGRWDSECPYAAFGLVYNWILPTNNWIADRFDRRMVQPVDATDCNWGTVEGTRPMLTYSNCISGFNPAPGASAAERAEAFETATAFAMQVLDNEMTAAEAHVAARDTVLNAGKAVVYKDACRVLMLDKFVPWQGHIFNRPDIEDLLYVAYPSERGGWCLQQIPVEPGSTEGRKPMPEAWAGLTGKALAAVTGLPLAERTDATFCHHNRFICGTDNCIELLIMARIAVAE